MMWGYEGGMMGANWAIMGAVSLVFWVIVSFDAILLGIWLWQNIQRKIK